MGKTDQQYIETVPKRGYRFVADVIVEDGSERGSLRKPAEPSAGATELSEQTIAFTVAADGVRIAYATSGEGPPLVKAANWLNHLEFDWRSPVWHHVMRELSAGRTLVRYDERGNGLSAWDVEDLSFEALVADLEAVVDAVGFERFPLLGISQGCAVSIVYAVRHPERVTRLVLHGGYARGWRLRDEGEISGWREGLVKMIRGGWGRDVAAFRQIFASLYIPDATPEQTRWWTDLQRITASPENAARLLETLGLINVLEFLPKVSAPTLVTHSRGDAVVPFVEGSGWPGSYGARGFCRSRAATTSFSPMSQLGRSGDQPSAAFWQPAGLRGDGYSSQRKASEQRVRGDAGHSTCCVMTTGFADPHARQLARRRGETRRGRSGAPELNEHIRVFPQSSISSRSRWR